MKDTVKRWVIKGGTRYAMDQEAFAWTPKLGNAWLYDDRAYVKRVARDEGASVMEVRVRVEEIRHALTERRR